MKGVRPTYLTLMLSMPSLVTVNNNVSLLSITIAPSTYVATLTLSFVFVYLYIVQISWKPTLLPNISYFKRTSRTTKTAEAAVEPPPLPPPPTYKALPAPPGPEASGAIVRRSNRHSSQHYQHEYDDGYETFDDVRSSRSFRRLLGRLRADDPATGQEGSAGRELVRAPVASLELPVRRRGERPGPGPRKLSLRRWLQSSGLAPPRKRESRQRLLAAE